MNKLVSAIIPTYNREKTICRAIDSILNQSYKNIEIIIVDDGSTDDTLKLLKKYGSRIRVVKQCHKGANVARNRGIKEAKGEYIAFLDSDNYWDFEKLEKQIILLQQERDAEICFCKVRVEDGGRDYIVPSQKIDCNCLGEILKKGNVVDTSTLLLRRSILDEAGGFDEIMPRLQDYELIFRLVNKFKYKVVYIDEVLVTNVMQNNSITKNPKLWTEGNKLFLEKNKDCFTMDELVTWVLNNMNIIRSDNEAARRENLEYLANDKELLICVTDSIAKQYIKKNEYAKFLSEWLDTDWSGLFGKIKNMNIAIYGIGKLGKLLMEECNKNNIKIKTVIDQNATSYEGVNIIRPDEFCKEIEIIIISVFNEGDMIKEQLKKIYQCEIFTLKELLKQYRR